VRKYIVGLLALGALALPSSALAGDDPPTIAPLPTPPSAVVDNATAATFARLYLARNVRDLLQAGGAGNFEGRRVRLVDTNATCLTSPVLATRFGCVFTLRAAVILRRSHGWDNWGREARASSKRDHGNRRDRNRRFIVRNFGCLGGLTINGGPSVTPTAQVRFIECGRISDSTLTEPTPVV